MRADMAKVIVERPRYGSSLPSQKKGYLRTLQATPIEEWPGHEPMLGRWRGMQRVLNEHLGPMRRYLRSQVGRPWNSIHRELCEHISFDNAVQKHVLTHIGQFVRRNVICCEDRLIRLDDYGREWPLCAGEMYVCPITGLLRIAKPSKRRSQPQHLSRFGSARGAVCLCRDGTWYSVRLQPLPLDGSRRWDVWLNRFVSLEDKALYSRTYQQQAFALSVTSTSQDEVRRRLRHHQEMRRRKRRRTEPAAACDGR